MNRNTESHFANTPSIGISRSKFDRSFTHKGTANTGDLFPIYCDCTIMPGDTVKMRASELIRMMTPITPVMDNCFADIYFFFVPYRLIWEHFREFMGENTTEPWKQKVEYEIPQVVAPETGWKKGDLMDFLGYPTKIGGYKGSALPGRAYALIWNEWFRDQNLKDPCYIYMGDSDTTGASKVDLGSSYDYVTDTIKGAGLCKAAKFHDYFTSCLPEPQKGPAINIPLGKTAPIIGTDDVNTGSTVYNSLVGEQLQAEYFSAGGATGFTVADSETGLDAMRTSGTTLGLAADLSSAVGATVNQLRQAFAIQKFYEKQALGGTRYIEMVKAHFSVTNPDFRMQRPEYLGGQRIVINMNQVIQTTPTGTDLTAVYTEDPETHKEVLTWENAPLTPQGNASAYSVTSGKQEDLFTHSFTEHGIMMGLCTIRTTHTYQQGLNAQYSKKKFTDFYFPVFANLGNQPVYEKELYLQGTNDDETVFGYQEAWATERYFPDIVTGEMRSNYDQPLDVWHYADNYESVPNLSSEWIDETEVNVARTLAVQDHDQFMFDMYFAPIYTRPMPLWSIPGLIDHH